MALNIRPGTPADAETIGPIIFDGFKTISDQHNFPSDFPSVDVGIGIASMLLSHPGFYSAVGEIDDRIVGSNFLDERSPVGGIGPLTIDPKEQNSGIGRRLMQTIIDRASAKQMPGIRLLQDGFHNRSFVLYTKLGFQTRGTTAVMSGAPLGRQISGYTVRPVTEGDVDKCNALCTQIHGHHRGGDLSDGIAQGTAMLVERDGQIRGYTSLLGFSGHSVGESTEDLKALIAAAPEFAGSGFHVPTDNTELLNWCLDNGLRMVKAMTIMSLGLYNQPRGGYLPSVLY